VQHRLLKQFRPHGIDQRLQLHAAAAHPLRQRRPRDRQPGTSKDPFLAIQRQVVGVLGHQHLREQAGRGESFIDHVRRHCDLHQLLALRAGPFAAHMPLHRKDAGLVIELLGDIFPDALHLAAAAAGGVLRLVVDLASRQLRRQRLALRLVLLARGLVLRHQALDLLGDRLQIGVERFLQQAPLLGVEALGLRGELQPLEHGVLVRELVDDRLLVDRLSRLALDHFLQLPHSLAKLLRIQ
jgi:hypothetical protein